MRWHMEGKMGKAKEARPERKDLGVSAYQDSYVQEERLSPKSTKSEAGRRSRQLLGVRYAGEILGKSSKSLEVHFQLCF